MAIAVFVASIICSIVSLVAWIQLVIAAFDDEIWKGIVGLVFWPYLLYWSCVEYYDKGKWVRIATWIGASILASVLIVVYFYVRLPAAH